MKVHLIHGIHATGGGNTAKLAAYLRAMGHEPVVHSYGYAFASTSLLPGWTNHLNRKRAAQLAPLIADGDSVACHSNGAAVTYCLMRLRQLNRVVMIQPALDADLAFPNARRVLCIHNAEDDLLGLSMILPGNYWGGLGKLRLQRPLAPRRVVGLPRSAARPAALRRAYGPVRAREHRRMGHHHRIVVQQPRRRPVKNLALIILIVALLAAVGLVWDLSAALDRVRQAPAASPVPTAPLCAPCRCDCPAPPDCPPPEKAEAEPVQPPIPPSLVLRLARQGKACALDGEPNITIMTEP